MRFLGGGVKTTMYWTALSDLPDDLVVRLKAGKPPWTFRQSDDAKGVLLNQIENQRNARRGVVGAIVLGVPQVRVGETVPITFVVTNNTHEPGGSALEQIAAWRGDNPRRIYFLDPDDRTTRKPPRQTQFGE